MRPVVLSVLDGKNFLIGTFDTTNFQSWWKSEPFPGAIDVIHKPVHVYGQYHCCIVKMQNGTYSIYRTKNMGKSWSEVYNTHDIIYTLNIIDYGWIIGSTSSGWIESKLDSGYTWTEISSFAPGCKNVINIGEDILFAHDGTKVWRSTDYAKTWSTVLDKTHWLSKPLHPDWSSAYFSYTGNAEPALAGINEAVFVGFGPYLVISEDLGETWTTHPSAWCNSIFNSPTWGNLDSNTSTLSFNPNQKILQIIITTGNGLPITEAKLMIRLLYNSNVYYRYSGNYNDYVAGWYIKTIFSTPDRSPSGEIISFDVQYPGSSLANLFTSINTYDNNNNPIVKYSINGGLHWTTINTSNVTVYAGDPSQEIISDLGQQTFDEEFWTTYSWVGAACHNFGRYIIEKNKTIRGISSDVDFLLGFTKFKTYDNDIIVKKLLEKNCSIDTLLQKELYKNNTIDLLILKNDIDKYYNFKLYEKTSLSKSYIMDIVFASRDIVSYSFDNLIQKTFTDELYPKMYLINTEEKTYSMGLSLIDNHVNQIMNQIERYTPQAPDIRYPNIPYNVWDSRKEGVTL